jgi:hypothetical protein
MMTPVLEAVLSNIRRSASLDRREPNGLLGRRESVRS